MQTDGFNKSKMSLKVNQSLFKIHFSVGKMKGFFTSGSQLWQVILKVKLWQFHFEDIMYLHDQLAVWGAVRTGTLGLDGVLLSSTGYCQSNSTLVNKRTPIPGRESEHQPHNFVSILQLGNIGSIQFGQGQRFIVPIHLAIMQLFLHTCVQLNLFFSQFSGSSLKIFHCLQANINLQMTHYSPLMCFLECIHGNLELV